MPMDRRRFCGMLAFSPFLFLQNNLAAFSKRTIAPAAYKVNLFFHGLFFMEYQQIGGKNYLVVGTPYYQPHNVGIIDHGSGIYKGYSGNAPEDLTTQLVGDDSVETEFPTDIMIFSRREIGQTGVVLDPSKGVGNQQKKFAMLLLLPRPKSILTLRDGGSLTDINLRGKTGASIKRHSGAPQSLVTCLEYDPMIGSGFSRSYYAEHCKETHDTEIGKIMKAARDTLGDNFDLEITGTDGIPTSPMPNEEAARALGELPYIKNNPCFPGPFKAEMEREQAARRNLNPANCPQFGIAP
jgi:hypothetical protein